VQQVAWTTVLGTVGRVTRTPTRSPRRDGGFTLVEILIAIVLVGILSAVVVVGVGSLTSKGSTAACSASLDAARTGLTTHLTSTGAYPTSFTDMTTSGSLQVPSGVTVTGGGARLQGNGWTLSLTSGNPPTLSCSGALGASATALAATSPSTWWPLDDAGPTFADRSGPSPLTNANFPQIQQPALAVGTGPSLCFAAAGVNLPTASAIQTNVTALSVAGWIKLPTGNGTAVLYQNRGPTGASQRGFSMTVSNGVIRWGLDTDGWFIGLTSTTTINDAQAHHVAGTWNGTTFTIYVDGVAAGTSTIAGWSGPFSSNQPSSIGFHPAWGMSSVGACTSDVSLWNRALTGTEVATLSTAGRSSGGYAPALAATSPTAWWPLDTAGPTFADRSGSATLTTPGAPQTQQPALAPGTGPSVCFTAAGSNLPTASAIQSNVTALSVAGWMKLPAGNGTAVLYQNRGPGGASQRGFSITVTNGVIRWGLDSDGVFIGPTSTTTINDAQAHHVAGTWNGTVYTLYVDGVAAGTTTITGWTGPFSSNQPASIGYHSAWGMSSVGACMSDVAVWNRALSSTEVATLAAAGR
jgi:prepilin-type N-terminal cleavage/methylation domain-containing protein